MRLARIGQRNAEMPVVVDTNGRFYDARPITPDFDAAFFADGGIERLADAVERGVLGEVSGDSRLGSPIAQPGSVICIGMNYAAHAAESGSAPPEVPVVFFKSANTVQGPFDPVEIPRGSTKTDWEVELGVVIGAPTAYLDGPDEAIAHIAGFTIANDLSERDFQLAVSGGQWSKGKCCPGFLPLGPYLVTPDEIDHQQLGLRSFVNGQPRQNSSTADQIFDVARIIYDLSQYMRLDPGDVILTGTPEGVALSGRFEYLRAGDEVRIEIDHLGHQQQTMVAWPALSRPENGSRD